MPAGLPPGFRPPAWQRGGANIVIGVVFGLVVSAWLRAVPDQVLEAALLPLERPAAASAPPPAGPGEPVDLGVARLPATVARWGDLFVQAGAAHGVDPSLLAIVALVESGGNPSARSTSGAAGLMQVMPATAVDIAKRRGIAAVAEPALYEAGLNVDFGAWYLADQLRRFGRIDDPGWHQSVALASAAYNGGPGHVTAHLQGAPLYTETAAYQEWVAGMWRERAAAESRTFDRWMAAGGWRLVAAAAASVQGQGAAGG
jgi:soluble lytic murein transglycosylase